MKGLILFASSVLMIGMLEHVSVYADEADIEDSTLNRAVEAAEGKAEEWAFNRVKDQLAEKAPYLTLKHVDNSGSSLKDGYAVEYDLSKAWLTQKEANIDPEKVKNKRGTLDTKHQEFLLFAKGAYAWDDTLLNDDLSSVGFSYRFHRSAASVAFVDPVSSGYLDCLTAIDENNDANASNAQKACWWNYTQAAPNRAGGAYFYHLAMNYHIEGNQDFTDKNAVYSASFVMGGGADEASPWQNLNVFDYPFRLTRKLTNSGNFNANFPSLAISLEQVDPSQNSPRLQIDGDDSLYDRVHFTSAFTSKVLEHKGLPLTFEWVYQRFEESGASRAVEDAKLDSFNYRKYTLYAPTEMFGLDLDENEFYLQYTSGRLPFSEINGRAVMVGWKTNLKSLFKSL